MGPRTCWGKVLFWLAIVANREVEHLFAVYLTSFDCFLYSTQYIPCNETKAGPSQLKWFALSSNTCSIPYLWNPSKCWISSAHIPDLYHNLSIIPRPLQPKVFDHLQVINNWRRWRLRNKTTVFLCPLSCCTDKLNYIPTASPLWRRYMGHSSDMVNLYSSIRMGGHFNFITSIFQFYGGPNDVSTFNPKKHCPHPSSVMTCRYSFWMASIPYLMYVQHNTPFQGIVVTDKLLAFSSTLQTIMHDLKHGSRCGCF